MSPPMSDTTNLAPPAVAEADLFDHIKAMFYTTGPGFLIALIVYLIMGFNYGGEVNSASINQILAALENTYNLSIITLIPPIIVIVLQ